MSVDLYLYNTSIIVDTLFWVTVYRKLGKKSGRKAYRTPHLKNTSENVHLKVRGHILQTLHQTALLLKRTGWDRIHAEVGIDGKFDGVSSFIKSTLQDTLEGKRDKLEALSCVEFVLELHPKWQERQDKRRQCHNRTFNVKNTCGFLLTALYLHLYLFKVCCGYFLKSKMVLK